MLLDSEVVEVRPSSSALKSLAVGGMQHHLRESRRYLQDVYCHELGPWQMKTPLYAQAICKCCSIAHHACITL